MLYSRAQPRDRQWRAGTVGTGKDQPATAHCLAKLAYCAVGAAKVNRVATQAYAGARARSSDKRKTGEPIRPSRPATDSVRLRIERAQRSQTIPSQESTQSGESSLSPIALMR